MHRLPQELVEHCIDLLVPSAVHRQFPTRLQKSVSAALAACSLVCHYWVPRSSSLLFHHVSLLSYHQLTQFLADVKISTRLSRHIHGLILHDLAPLPEGMRYFDVIFATLPRLKSLSLQLDSWDPYPASHHLPLPNSVHQHTVEDLFVGQPYGYPHHLLPGYLRAFKRVKHLHVFQVSGGAAVVTGGQSNKLHVGALTAHSVTVNVLMSLATFIAPQSLRRIEIIGERRSDPPIMRGLDVLLGTCGSNIDHLLIDLTWALGEGGYTPYILSCLFSLSI